jgi:hypothetical protein
MRGEAVVVEFYMISIRINSDSSCSRVHISWNLSQYFVDGVLLTSLETRACIRRYFVFT